MSQSGHTPLIESRSVAIGLGLFVVVVIVLPLVMTLIASLGPRAWIYTLSLVMSYHFVLYLLTGFAAGYWSIKSPLVTTIVIGFLGGALSLILSLSIDTNPDPEVMERVLTHVLESTFWCAAGGVSFVLYKNARSAL